MTVVYRFKTDDGVDFATVGVLEKAEGLYVIRCSARYDDVHMLQASAKRKRRAIIYVEVDDQVVGVMRAERIRADAKQGGQFVELWVIVGPVL